MPTDDNELLSTLRGLRYRGFSFGEIIYEMSMLVGEVATAAVGKSEEVENMASELEYELKALADFGEQLDAELYEIDDYGEEIYDNERDC